MKNIAFQIDDQFHKQFKIQATQEGKSIKDYIIELIKMDLELKQNK